MKIQFLHRLSEVCMHPFESKFSSKCMQSSNEWICVEYDTLTSKKLVLHNQIIIFIQSKGMVGQPYLWRDRFGASISKSGPRTRWSQNWVVLRIGVWRISAGVCLLLRSIFVLCFCCCYFFIGGSCAPVVVLLSPASSTLPSQQLVEWWCDLFTACSRTSTSSFLCSKCMRGCMHHHY